MNMLLKERAAEKIAFFPSLDPGVIWTSCFVPSDPSLSTSALHFVHFPQSSSLPYYLKIRSFWSCVFPSEIQSPILLSKAQDNVSNNFNMELPLNLTSLIKGKKVFDLNYRSQSF